MSTKHFQTSGRAARGTAKQESPHLHIPAPTARPATSFFHRVTTLAAMVAGVALLTGCASVRQETRTEVEHPDGTKEVRSSTSHARVLWEAKQSLEKVRVTNGKTQSIGLAGVDNESSATNSVATLEALARVLGQLRP